MKHHHSLFLREAYDRLRRKRWNRFVRFFDYIKGASPLQ